MCLELPARVAMLTFHVAWLGGLKKGLAAKMAGGDTYDVGGGGIGGGIVLGHQLHGRAGRILKAICVGGRV